MLKSKTSINSCLWKYIWPIFAAYIKGYLCIHDRPLTQNQSIMQAPRPLGPTTKHHHARTRACAQTITRSHRVWVGVRGMLHVVMQSYTIAIES